MRIETIRENAEPFGTEYSCMMMLIVKNKLVIVRPGTKEFEAIEKVVLQSNRLTTKGIPKEATGDDLHFFFNALRELGPKSKSVIKGTKAE
ncbi:MAG: hypothetical protein WA102_01550 [Candidatus Methanoperedens sp.]